MKIIREKMVRYGEENFDKSYINWGFHSLEEQVKDANSILPIIKKDSLVLDVACGIGRYHKVWTNNGIKVTGIDLSKTFINKCKELNDKSLTEYMVCDLNELSYKNKFDVVTWLDPAYVCGKFIRNIYKSIKENGVFIFDVRNPNFPRYRSFRNNKGKTWGYKDGTYKLVRDEYNFVTQKNEYEEITIDTNKENILIREIEGEDISLLALKDILYAAGFEKLKQINREGKEFKLTDETVQRFWLVATK